MTPAMERFHRGDFTLMTRTFLKAIRPGECTVRPVNGSREQMLSADVVMLITPNKPLDDIYVGLRDEMQDIRRIGDAAAPRDMQTAIREGRRVAMALG